MTNPLQIGQIPLSFALLIYNVSYYFCEELEMSKCAFEFEYSMDQKKYQSRTPRTCPNNGRDLCTIINFFPVELPIQTIIRCKCSSETQNGVSNPVDGARS